MQVDFTNVSGEGIWKEHLKRHILGVVEIFIMYLQSSECFNTAISERHFEACVIVLELYY